MTITPPQTAGAETGDPEGRAGCWAVATSVGLVSLPALAFALGQALLLAGGGLTPGWGAAILAISIGLSLLAAWRAAGRWTAPAAVAAIGLCATLLCAVVLDTSFDGQGYHFEAVTALAQGWNPFRTADPTVTLHGVVSQPGLWVRHYPQGAWISSAVQAAAGLPSEAAKNQAAIIMAALFLAVLGVALEFRLGRLEATVLAALAAANPVIVAQLFTRMNDGLLGACLALIATFSVLWILRPRWWAAWGAVCALIFVVNLKFSAIPMAAGVCALACLFALALRGWRAALRIGATLAIAGVVGIAILGAHPYVTNTLHDGHPFFPLMGEGKVDIMVGNRPGSFRDMTPLERMAASYFGPTANHSVVGLKPPFRVYRTELRSAGYFDPRVGGFGPLFSGALVLAALLAAAAWLQRSRPEPATRMLAGAAGVLTLALIMPEAWWARYVPQVWWAVVLIAMAAWLSRPRALRLGGAILAAVLLADAAMVAASSALLVGERTVEVRRQLAEMGRQAGPVCLDVGPSPARLALLGDDLARKVRLRSTPLEGCRIVPLAGQFPDSKAGWCPCR